MTYMVAAGAMHTAYLKVAALPQLSPLLLRETTGIVPPGLPVFSQRSQIQLGNLLISNCCQLIPGLKKI